MDWTNMVVIAFGCLAFLSVFALAAFNPRDWTWLKPTLAKTVLNLEPIVAFREKDSKLSGDSIKGHNEIIFAGVTLSGASSGRCYDILKRALTKARRAGPLKLIFILLDPRLSPDHPALDMIARRRGGEWTGAAVLKELEESVAKIFSLRDFAAIPEQVEVRVIDYDPGASVIGFSSPEESQRLIFSPPLYGIHGEERLSFDLNPRSGVAYEIAHLHLLHVVDSSELYELP